ncbi:MAG: amidohydrolase family protein [Bacteroidetes bacterium]|jgi:imidazolonepropionase-like amidohydrolase|nr:amidohydrolase family protein [Bacteroidota bacterium]
MIRATQLLLLLACCFQASAQATFPNNGVQDQRERYYALTGATVYTNYDTKIDNATLIIRKGKVVEVQQGSTPPEGAVVLDMAEKTIYPAFIDLYSDYGMPEPKAVGKAPQRKPQMLSNKPGAYAWNEALKTEFDAHAHFDPSAKTAKALREVGFGAVAAQRMDGISRGTAALVSLGDERAHEMIVKQQAAHALAFNKGTSTQSYPNSLMGMIALLRQTYLDGEWYAQQDDDVNLSLQAWNNVQELPQLFAVNDRLEVLRAGKLGQEFGKTYIIKGNGDEYQRLDEIKALNTALILPLDFPKAYDVEDPYDAQQVTLAQLKHWEMAPANPARLAEAGIPFTFTAHGLKKPAQFIPHLRKAVQYGLDETAALKALTHTPAELLRATDQLGSLQKGKLANFVVTDGDLFQPKTKLLQTWVKGKAYTHQAVHIPALLGEYELQVDDQRYALSVSGSNEKPKLRINTSDTTSIKVKFSRTDDLITLSFAPDTTGKVRLSGTVDAQNWSGKGQDATGQWVSWSATFQDPGEKAAEENPDEAQTTTVPDIGEAIYPFTAYGWTERPQAKTYLIKGATVWTNEEDGILEDTDVLLRNGKIAGIGQGLSASDATVIDAQGMHLTPGIVDEHSHIAISRGVNESSQASTAEVRIGDVINSEDINIYRQLSGGVTTSQLLHGSANPIGGQSAIIKLRWGYSPEDMKFAEAAPFIKFALGENVKQSNWGDEYTVRYPQTRMGVERVYVDKFTQALAYGEKVKAGQQVRRDLDREALLEIVNGERFITCHSYRQSEINMLMKVAERFGFRINTFTHILEGYKVADKMAEHGAGGSSFSDWWAYKYEVQEAIPYNGALMHEQGVTVAFNSDDAEMARRLNQEAAKAVRFGGVSEEDALKFITLNPAKLLHVDEYVGSIKEGKHADVVLWSGHPLSMYSRAEMTFIDGIKFFDREQDQQMREELAAERHRIIQQMLSEKKNGGKTQPASSQRQYRHYHCDDYEDEAK